LLGERDADTEFAEKQTNIATTNMVSICSMSQIIPATAQLSKEKNDSPPCVQ